MKEQYVSIQRIFANMGKFINNNNITEVDVIEWTGKALEFMKLETVFQPAVKLAEVVNYQVAMPNYLHAVVQIARNNLWVSDEVLETVAEESAVEEDTIDIPVSLDENGMPVDAYDLAFYRPYADHGGEYFEFGSIIARPYQFSPVRLANHSFFNSLVCKENDFDGIYATCKDEYTIVENLFRFSFETGQVMISYLKQILDENGYPMIPDNVSAITAIENFIRMKVFQEDFDNNRDGAERKYMSASSDWHWYCGQAQNEDFMPQSIDEWQNLVDMKNHLIPKKNRYYGFFGALSHPEQLKF